MPIDRAMIDPILTPFKNMIKDLEDKGNTGENYQKMVDTINAIEKLASELNDFNAFNAEVTKQGYYMNFSNYYSAALSETAKENAESGTDDETLLANTLKVYEDSIKRLEQSNAKDKIRLIEPIKKVIEIGKSGVTFPEFLRIVEEKGLNNAMEGTTVLRDYLLEDIKYSQDFYMPIHEQMYKEELAKFDELSEKSPFGVPDSLEYSLARQKIEWKYEPQITKWNMIIDRWERILSRVYDWLDSFCSFAPQDERWKTPGSTPAIVRHNIKRTQETTPYYLAVMEQIFYDYFSLKWNDIWEHETYKNAQKANIIEYSQERIDLIKKTYEQMKPGAKPTDDLIKKSEELYASGKHLNPDCRKELAAKAKALHDKAFGGE